MSRKKFFIEGERGVKKQTNKTNERETTAVFVVFTGHRSPEIQTKILSPRNEETSQKRRNIFRLESSSQITIRAIKKGNRENRKRFSHLTME